jgi:hypothetical protein
VVTHLARRSVTLSAGAWRGWLGAACVAAITTSTSSACIDPVHDSDVAALGPDTMSPGPTHRPGQPCLVCHGGSGPANLVMSFGGTVYDTEGQSAPGVGVTVQIEDVLGNFAFATTNSAGNFYVTAHGFSPHYPVQMQVTSADGNTTQQMLTHSSREGSCAVCHLPQPGPTSPGPVFVNLAPPSGG